MSELQEGLAVLYVVATPLGNLADLSQRARETLTRVPWVAAEDTRHTQPLLRHIGASARCFAVHEHNEVTAAGQVIDRLAAGEAVALVSDAGTPAISDPGARVVARVRAAGYPVVPIPGPCAAVTALSAAGIDDARWMFVGFLPVKGGERQKALAALAPLDCALVFYEAPHRIEETVADLATCLPGDRTLVVGRELTKVFEQVESLPLAEAPAWFAAEPNRRRGEFVLVVSGPRETAAPELGEQDRVLGILLDEGLPVKQVARLAHLITGASRNSLYERALVLRQAAGE